MITLKELLGPNSLQDCDAETKENLFILLERISKFREIYGHKMVITSGVRAIDQHIAIYQKMGFSLSEVPLKSLHLRGGACDVHDPEGHLMRFCKGNVKILEDIGLWCEEKDNKPRVHFQIKPPKSGNRFFKP